MLLQPKQMLAQVFEGRHRADPTTASASSDSAWPRKGTRSPACLWWMHGVSASWMSWSNRRAQWWTTAPGHLHKPFLPLSFRAAALSRSACCTGPFKNPLVCTDACCIPLSVKNTVLAVWLQWPTLSVQSAAQCPWGYQAEPLPFCSVPGKVLLQINDTQYKLLPTAGYKIRWSP